MKKGWILRLINKPLIKGVLKSVPVLGDLVDNITESTFDAPEGVLDKNKLIFQIVRIAILCILLYLVFSGKISFEEAEDAKQFLNYEPNPSALLG